MIRIRHLYPSLAGNRPSGDRRTHIDTLADATPKARRRVRRVLGWGSLDFGPDGRNIDRENIERAQHQARANERREALRVAELKARGEWNP
jgi:hypothetical protein